MTDARQNAYYPGFEGTVGKVFATSESWWPPRPTAPEGAPNVVIVMADDLGFSDVGCYGSEIPTPAIDALADAGIRYANFHVTPLCSPTRASLMTGLNPHAAGMGFVANADPGFPGYASELPHHQPSIAEMLRANGYSTMAVGKWHLCKEEDLSVAGDNHSWPLQRGFDQFYGILEALTNFHHPHMLYEGNSPVDVDEYPPGYYFTDDITARACRMIREVKTADPTKPLFLYYAHGAVHAPLHAKAEDIAKHRGKYDQGWDRLREQRLARQIELGIMPPGTELPPRNFEATEAVEAWDSLPADQQTVMARYMEVYAAMVDTIDDSVGKIRAELEALGELDNTIFIFMSDNGASREGREMGTTSYFSYGGTGVASSSFQEDLLANLDAIGGPTTWPAYPRGWAMACNTPFRLYKITTHRGGHSVPFVVSWPAGDLGSGDTVRNQYTYVTDVLPTLAELLGIEVPRHRHGLEAEPIAGVSFAESMSDPLAPTVHNEQYFECIGHRGFYRDGWGAVTFHQNQTPFNEDTWELYNVDSDVNERHNLADSEPEKLAELIEAWDDAAWRNRVFPLDEGTRLVRVLRSDQHAALARPLRILADSPTVERYRSQRVIGGRSFTITIDLDYLAGEGVAGDEGVLVAHGGQDAGYVIWIEAGQLYFEINQAGEPRRLDPMPLPSHCRQIVVDVVAPGGRIWNIDIAVDGVPGIRGEGLMQIYGFLPFEGIDVGIDRRSPVSWELSTRRGSFAYSGDIRQVLYEPGEYSPDAEEVRIEELREIGLALE